MKLISSALLKAQSEMTNPKKTSVNPFFKSKYADLNSIREAVMPVLNTNGIVVLQPIIHENGKNFVKTILLHESGEQLDSITEIIYNRQNDAQAQGSGITYARRYALASFICIGADDDDGQKATAPAPAQKKQNATIENLKSAREKGFDIENVKKYYNVTPEQEQEFLTL